MTVMEMLIVVKRERLKEVTNELDGLEEEFIMRKKSLENEKRTLEQQLLSMERGKHE